MKIVFVAAHSQIEVLGKYYKQINEVLEQNGENKVFSGYLFSSEKEIESASKSQREKWYREGIHRVKSADLVVVEISYPSTANIGHILATALEAGRSVIAIYHKDRDPFFLKGRVDERLMLVEYDEKNIKSVVKGALEYITSVQDTRFNFFISPEIGAYLDWISKKKRIPRAVYLRKLIEEEMKENTDYQGS